MFRHTTSTVGFCAGVAALATLLIGGAPASAQPWGTGEPPTEIEIVETRTAFRPIASSGAAPEIVMPQGPFGFSYDHQCAAGGAGFCCQLDDLCTGVNGRPANGGPYFAHDDVVGNNDFIRLNFYWSQRVPEDLSDAECRSFEVRNSAALIPRLHPGEALFLLRRSSTSFGDLCAYRGQTMRFCRSLAFFPRKIVEDELLPWAFTVDAPRAPGMLGGLDIPGLDLTSDASCTP